MSIEGQDMEAYQIFLVSFGNAKITESRVSPKSISAKISINGVFG